MLGTEPILIEEYVQTGQLRIIFWPVLNHGSPSVYSTLTAECAGQQNSEHFWTMHYYLFERSSQLYSADRDFYIQAARNIGLDEELFTTCYDQNIGLDTIKNLDQIRIDRRVYSQPAFDLNGEFFYSAPAPDRFKTLIETALNKNSP
ncbi:MAG TPA: thioredoxin domain-containing protein [Anaerolineae bacterium]|nr:thioredoxin domain-containing protein [Anaerolineae bacterium]